MNQKINYLTLAIDKDEATLKQFHKLGLLKDIKIIDNSIIVNPENNQIIQNQNSYNSEEYQAEKFYDLIINIKSIKDISKGWEIKMTERGEENFNKYKNIETLKLGVIGNSNKGKSFILSRISRIKLPSGTSIKTEGLSIKYPELDEFKDRKIVLLDSAGLEAPVLEENILDENDKIEYKEENGKNVNDGNKKLNHEKKEVDTSKDNKEENKKDEYKKETNNDINEVNKNKTKGNDDEEKSKIEIFKERSREKLITELFLQKYIINNSDILLLVVGILTYSEQKLLNRIKAEFKNAKINKPLYIIHNLKTFYSKKQVESYIKETLFKSATFKLKEAHKIRTDIKEKNGIHYFEVNNNIKIFHLIFANEGSEAGDYYNKYTLNFIENTYQVVTELKSYDVIETIKRKFVDLSKEIFEKSDKEIKYDDMINNDEIMKDRIIKLKVPQKIILKECFIDELGFSLLKGNGFEPNYNYYEKDNKLIIRVEVPGNVNIESEIKYLGEFIFIKLKGTKKKDKEPKDISDNIENTREFGDFYLEFPINKKFKIKNGKPKISNVKGLLIIEYDLEENEQKGVYEAEDEV